MSLREFDDAPVAGAAGDYSALIDDVDTMPIIAFGQRAGITGTIAAPEERRVEVE